MRIQRFLFALILLALASERPVLSEEPWQELKGDHFIVYHLGDGRFAEDLLGKAEAYYRNISNDLGYQRYSNFWQWENRVKIYIYKTQQDFLKASGRQEWSHGYASYTKKEIRSYLWAEGFLDALLPHEITHLVFRDYVGFQGEIPVWLDEGVAQWEEPQKRAIVQQVMKSYLHDEKGFKFDDLMTLDIRTVDFAPSVELFYVQAMSIIDFLISRFGADQFIFFCRQLRDGKTINEALRFAYPTQIRNTQQMEEKWKEFVLSR